MKSLTIICFSFIMFSCVDDSSRPQKVKPLIQNDSDDTFVCMLPEKMPEFPGGVDTMMTFVQDNLVHPRSCVEGYVFVGFVVETNGTLSDISVLEGIDKECNHNAVEVIKKMPKLIPGRNHKNELSRVRMVLPIKF